MNIPTKQELFGAGLSQSQKIRKSFLGGIRFGTIGVASDIGLLGFQASKAGRGAFLPSMIGQSMALMAGIPLAGVASAAVSLIPGVGPLAAGIIGNLLLNYGEYRTGNAFIGGVKLFSNTNKRVRHLEMGGNYRDTESAQRQRFLAIQDMNSTMIPGRRYLGQEALLMHR